MNVEDRRAKDTEIVNLTPIQDEELVWSGYQPVPASGKAVYITGWREGEITVDRLAAWREQYPDHTNTGFRTDNLSAVDLDIVSEPICKKIAALAGEMLGDTPLVRKGKKGMLLVYRASEPMKKIRITHGDDAPLIEVLCQGQQFIGFGVHPDTGKPYQWLFAKDGVVQSPLTVHADNLPEVSPDKIRAFIKVAAEVLGETFKNVKISGDTGEVHEASASTGAPITEKNLLDILSLKKDGKPVFNPAAGRDQWRDNVAAIGWANVVGDDADHTKAKDIACRWSRGEVTNTSHEGKYQGDDDVLHTIETMPPKKGGVSLGSIIKKAQDNGWKGNPFDTGTTAQQAFAKLPEQYRQTAEQQDLTFPDIGNNGAIKATTPNCRVALQLIGLHCSHDVFHDKLLVGGKVVNQTAGQLTDEVVTRLCYLVHEKFGFEPPPQKMQTAIEQLCFQNKFNPVTDYLDGLKWDGIKRIDKWLIDHAGAPDTPFVRAVSCLMLVAAVRRARQPGCKFDEIIVLESPEGFNKSGMIELMFGSENFSDQSILAGDDRKQQEQMQGVWGYELADLSGIRKAEAEKLKAFASRQEDRCRPAYGRNTKHQKRQCVLIATTNDSDYLQSQTGNRRWWPIKITKRIDLRELAAVRNQLWAEAAQLERQGVSIRLPSELWADAGKEQEQRRLRDPWEDLLASVKGKPYPIPGDEGHHELRVQSGDILLHTLRLDPGQLTAPMGKRLKQVMIRLGWTYKEGVRIGDRASGGYVRTVAGPVPRPEPVQERDEELPDDPWEQTGASA